MSSVQKKTKRTMIPRWRQFGATMRLRGLRAGRRPSIKPATHDLSAVVQRQEEFNSHHTIWHAADWLDAAVAHDDYESARRASNFILEHRSDASIELIELAKRFGGEVSEEPPVIVVPVVPREIIEGRRRQLSVVPQNSIAHVDLALAYTILGLTHKAGQHIRAALALAPADRFVLRSANRMLIHTDDFEQAHELLRRNPRTLEDPWLLSAEIASASARGQQSRFLSNGLRMLNSGEFSFYDTSELAASLLTVELATSPSQKRVKKLNTFASSDPTENSIAQLQFLAGKCSVTTPRPEDTANTFEAQALANEAAGAWDKALTASLQWFEDQPFSAVPAVKASFIASMVTEEFDVAEMVLRRALLANPRDPYLLNNLAFTLAKTARPEEAFEYLSKIFPASGADPGTKVASMATAGLIEYARGNAREGKRLYLTAIQEAKSHSETAVETILGLLLLARQEESFDIDLTQRLLSEADSLSTTSPSPVFRTIRQRVKNT